MVKSCWWLLTDALNKGNTRINWTVQDSMNSGIEVSMDSIDKKRRGDFYEDKSSELREGRRRYV